MSVEAEIQAFSDAFDRALLDNDPDAVAGYMAPEWVYVGPNGITQKLDLIAKIRAGHLAHWTMETVGPSQVLLYGDTAVLTARKKSSGATHGTPYTADEWMTDVFVRLEHRWICVLTQSSPIG